MQRDDGGVMPRTARLRRAATALAVILPILASSAAAHADAPRRPPNDLQSRAQHLGLPSLVRGTTVGATVGRHERGSVCTRSTGASVWYSVTADRSGALAIRVRAARDVDVVLNVLRRYRAGLADLGCSSTERGVIDRVVFARRGERLLIRVARPFRAHPGRCSLQLAHPEPPASVPSTAIARTRVRSSLDSLLDRDDAWSWFLRE